ncbi:hypothetical protein L1987_05975 [Smallanthus sonchifolius]|uniref:Uncharacterized protein n=1 Tax=Smallanthus sonchifolius TaxID=185202 RepID=A0ACB9JX14_9ASTR|nr:hypothetical protein L1987_05975 [Smallanthus sonchifolius]
MLSLGLGRCLGRPQEVNTKYPTTNQNEKEKQPTINHTNRFGMNTHLDDVVDRLNGVENACWVSVDRLDDFVVVHMWENRIDDIVDCLDGTP